MSEMTCREFDEIVHGFVRMELLDVNAREAALEHAAHCELCAERMADAAALAEATEAMARSARELQAPPHVETSLRVAFRSHHRRTNWRRTLEWASVGASAAVLLIFLWTANGRSKGQAPAGSKKDDSSQSSLPLEAKAPVAPKPDVNAPQTDAVVADGSGGGSYSASDFVPVPFSGAITADDPGMVVRVQLTRSSLAQLGYPVAETPDEGLILADVLVGEDGWPRGVKLIQ
jgi:hypothetical protein